MDSIQNHSKYSERAWCLLLPEMSNLSHQKPKLGPDTWHHALWTLDGLISKIFSKITITIGQWQRRIVTGEGKFTRWTDTMGQAVHSTVQAPEKHMPCLMQLNLHNLCKVYFLPSTCLEYPNKSHSDEGIFQRQKLEVGYVTLCWRAKECSLSHQSLQDILDGVECQRSEKVGSHGNNGSAWEDGIVDTTENSGFGFSEGPSKCKLQPKKVDVLSTLREIKQNLRNTTGNQWKNQYLVLTLRCPVFEGHEGRAKKINWHRKLQF